MNLLKNYINKNMLCIAIAVVLFMSGIVIGSAVAVNLSPADADELKSFLSPMVSYGALGTVNMGNIVANGCIGHFRFVAAMVICSISIWLLPLACVIFALKGYQLGFSVSFLCGNFGFRGVALSVVSSFVSYAVSVPVYLILFCAVIRRAIGKYSGIHRRNNIKLHVFVTGYVVLCCSSIIEGVLFPIFIDMFY